MAMTGIPSTSRSRSTSMRIAFFSATSIIVRTATTGSPISASCIVR